jgi:ubiquinone/menaquinone biosynthesis C-methylase UbiE
VKDLQTLYRVRFSEAERARKDRVWKVLCKGFFQQYIAPSDTVLEIASGYGEFIRHIVSSRKIAVDLNPEARDCLPVEVEFHLANASRLTMIADGSVDTCFSSNFFEHLPSKEVMDEVLAEVLRVLRPGGRYVVMQPNIRYEPGRYWDYYDHILPLSHLSCREAFAKAGYEVVEVIDRFVPFSTDSRLPQHPLLVRLYLNCRPIWRWMGGQFVLVGRKPVVMLGGQNVGWAG